MAYITIKIPTDYEGKIVIDVKPKAKIPVIISPRSSSPSDTDSLSTTPSPAPRPPRWKSQPRGPDGRFIKE